MNSRRKQKVMNISEVINDLKPYENVREDEKNWLILNNNISILTTLIFTLKDIELILTNIPRVIEIALLSDRSKLSGTAFLLISKMGEYEINLSIFIHPLLKLCNRPSKIFYGRAQEALLKVAAKTNLSKNVHLWEDSYKSANKMVRLVVIKAVKNDKSGLFKDLLEKAKKDPSQEVRNEVKELYTGYSPARKQHRTPFTLFGTSRAPTIQTSEIPKTITICESDYMKNRRVGFNSKISEQAVSKKKETNQGTPVELTTGTFHTDIKIENTAITVKDISKSEYSETFDDMRNRISNVRTVNDIKNNQPPAISTKLSHDALTPKTLDKYIRKYKEDALNKHAERNIKAKFDKINKISNDHRTNNMNDSLYKRLMGNKYQGMSDLKETTNETPLIDIESTTGSEKINNESITHSSPDKRNKPEPDFFGMNMEDLVDFNLSQIRKSEGVEEKCLNENSNLKSSDFNFEDYSIKIVDHNIPNEDHKNDTPKHSRVSIAYIDTQKDSNSSSADICILRENNNSNENDLNLIQEQVDNDKGVLDRKGLINYLEESIDKSYINEHIINNIDDSRNGRLLLSVENIPRLVSTNFVEEDNNIYINTQKITDVCVFNEELCGVPNNSMSIENDFTKVLDEIDVTENKILAVSFHSDVECNIEVVNEDVSDKDNVINGSGSNFSIHNLSSRFPNKTAFVDDLDGDKNIKRLNEMSDTSDDSIIHSLSKLSLHENISFTIENSVLEDEQCGDVSKNSKFFSIDIELSDEDVNQYVLNGDKSPINYDDEICDFSDIKEANNKEISQNDANIMIDGNAMVEAHDFIPLDSTISINKNTMSKKK